MPPLSGKWTLCLLLFLATTLNYLDRQALGMLAPIIQKDLGFNNHQLGLLFAVFYYSYTLAQFAVGGLLDRWNLRWAYAVGVLAWSTAAALTATASGFAALMVFRVLLGLTESINWPAAMRIVARALPPAERSLGNGIFTSGTSIGALIAPGLILGIAGASHWRWGFLVVGSFGLLWFAIWIITTRAREYGGLWEGSAAANSAAAGYRAVVASPQFWRVLLVAILVNPCLYFLLNWLPTYFTQHWRLEAGNLAGILTLVFIGLDLGYLACGVAILGLTRSGWTVCRARRLVLYFATVLLSLAAIVPQAGSVSIAVALLVMANFGAGCWISMYLTMAQEISETHVSTAAGLLGGSGSLAGAFAMWAVGKITHETGSFALPLAGVAVAAVIAAVAGAAVARHADVYGPAPVSAGSGMPSVARGQ